MLVGLLISSAVVSIGYELTPSLAETYEHTRTIAISKISVAIMSQPNRHEYLEDP